jgi:hypothetical protein
MHCITTVCIAPSLCVHCVTTVCIDADPHRLAAVCTIATSSAAPLYASSKLILIAPALYASHLHASPADKEIGMYE